MAKTSFSELPRRFAKGAGALGVSAGAVVLLGWVLNNGALQRIFAGWPKMAPLTALTFVLTGLALWSTATESSSSERTPQDAGRSARWFSRACVALVLAIALLKGTDYLLGWHLGIDLFGLVEQEVARPTIMAPAVAFSFLCLGSALSLASTSRLRGVFHSLPLLSALMAWLGISRYVFAGQVLIPYTPMAAHTALLILLLSVGTLSLRTDVGLMGLLTSNDAGGIVARRLIPAALVVPTTVGWLCLKGQYEGLYGTEVGALLFALANVLVFGGLIWQSAALLHRTDAERRRAEKEVRAGEELLHALADNSPAIIYIKDLNGRYLLVNRRFEELFHVRRAEMIGKTDYDVFPKESADTYRTVDQRVLATGTAIEAEEVAPQDDGPHTYISIKYPLRDANHTLYAVCGISTDISERKQAEQALHQSEERTRAIIETALDAIVAMDHEGRIVEFNPAAERIFGYRSDEAINRPLAEVLIPPSLREKHWRGLARYLATGDGPVLNKRIELAGMRADGAELPVELSIARMPGTGPPIFIGFLRDVTEQRLAAEKLQAQLGRLDLLSRITRAIGERQDLHSIFQVVIRTLEDSLPIDFGCICLYDPSESLLTVTSVGVRGAQLAVDLAMPERSKIAVDQNGLSQCVQGQMVYEPDIRGLDHPFPRQIAGGGLCSLVAAPLLFESQVFGVLLAARREPHSFSSGDCDFLRQLSEHVALATRQAQIYENLQGAYEELRQTQAAVMQQERLRALGQMASGIAHDINNSISPVALYTESLLEREMNLSSRGREHLKTIARAIDDVAHTVSRMREFYRQTGPHASLVPLRLELLIQQVLELTRARWRDMPQERGVALELQTEFAPDVPQVMGVEGEIRDALTNLIFNAIDAMPVGGTLSLRLRAVGVSPAMQVHLEIQDTGIGMSEETRRRCLEPFFTTKGERGTGLGLAMVYGMAQRHGADIEIESAPGKGTVVRLIFAASPPVTAQSVGVDSSPPLVQSRRILVVDDDPLVLKSLRDTLEADGHVVTTAEGGEAGIAAFVGAHRRGEPFAMVITDLGMPQLDGRRVAAAIKAVSSGTPVILLTGWGQRLATEQDIPKHIDRLLSKPPKLQELRTAIRELTSSTRTIAV